MDEVQRAMRRRYSHIHPLIFQRSCEKAKSNGELFDILETVPKKMPVVWNDEKRRWIVADLLQYDED